MRFSSEILPLTRVEGSKRIFNNTDTVLDGVSLDADSCKSQWIRFENLTFNETFYVQQVNIGIGIFFLNCNFKKVVVFDNVSGEGYSTDFTRESVTLGFRNCIFEQNVQFRNNCLIERGILFDKCTLYGGLQIFKCQITVQQIALKDSTINTALEFEEVTSKMGVSISGCEIDTRVRFYLGNLNSIGIIRSVFKRDLLIWGTEVNQSIAFNDGEYYEGVNLKSVAGRCSLNIHGGKYQAGFRIAYDGEGNQEFGIKFLYLTSCNFEDGFYFNGKGNRIHNHKIEKLTLKLSDRMNGDVFFRDTDFGLIELSGSNNNCNIQFERTTVIQLFLNSFINHSKLSFIDFKASLEEGFTAKDGSVIKNRLGIFQSTVGSARFYASDLSNFRSVQIKDSTISEIQTSVIKWFDARMVNDFEAKEKELKKYKNDVAAYPIEKNRIAVRCINLKELFRQLKYAMEKQGDKVQALEFQRWEMHYYRKYLVLTENSNWQDKFVLWLSQSNDFGQNWAKALWLGLIFTFIFYIPIALLGSDKVNPLIIAQNFDDIWISIKEIFWGQIAIYAQLINPTHVMARMYKDVYKLPGAIHVFDGLHRIITAYFIAQIIFAFRKYVK